MNEIVERFGDKDALVTAAGDRLVDAITAVLEATEVLRLELRSTDDGPQQRIPHRPPGFQVEIVDLRAQADPPAAAEDWMRRQVAQRIEFGRDRLVTEQSDQKALRIGCGKRRGVFDTGIPPFLRRPVDCQSDLVGSHRPNLQ